VSKKHLEGINLSLERMLQLLKNLGFSRVEAEVYVYLTKTGPTKAKDLTIGLRITKQQLYPALKGLKKRRIVSSRPERHALFSALAFEELLNRYVKTNLEQADTIKKTKEELLTNWRNMAKQNNT
jgi:sugar-specific transcriptional regulator TrmB